MDAPDKKPLRRLLLVVEYDGGSLFGSQKQAVGETVQSLLETAIERLTCEKRSTVFCSRTDRGVHAGGMLVTFDTASRIATGDFNEALTAHLPAEVAVTSVREVPADFHPMEAARSKIYRFTILNRGIRSPRFAKNTWLIKPRLNVNLMREAAAFLTGTQDFRSFTSEARTKENTIRTIISIIIRREGDLIEIDVHGTGFLYNMVRAIAGTLVEVGRGKRPPEWLKEVIEARSRGTAGKTAPPEGLVLVRVIW